MSAGFTGYRRTIQLDFDYDKVKAGVPKVNQQMALLNAEFNKASASIKNTGSAMDNMVLKNQKLANQVAMQKDKVSSLEKELQKLTESEKKNDRAIASKQISLKNAQAALINMENAYKESNAEIAKTSTLSGKVKLAMEDMRLGFERAGVDVDKLKMQFAALGAAVVAFVTTSGKAFVDFESSMIKSKTIMDETQLSYKQMQANVLQMSRDYNIAAETMAEANYQILSSNIATSDANRVLAESAKLAKTGFTDVATAADILTSIMNGYSLSVNDASTVVDQLIKTQKVGKLTVGELSQSMGDLIGIASSLNVPIQEVEAAIAAMTQSGIKADTAITNTKQILSTIANPAAGAAEAARKYGVSLDAASISSEGFAKWLDETLRKTKGNSAALGEMFGNVKSWSGMVTLAKENGSAFTQVLNEISNSAGTTDAALASIEETTGEKLGSALNELKVSLIEVGDTISPIIEVVAGVIDTFGKLPAPVLLTGVSMAGLSVTVSLLKKVFSGLSMSTGLVGAAMKVLGLGATGASASMTGTATSGGFLSKVLSSLGLTSSTASASLSGISAGAAAASASLGATGAAATGASAGLTTVGTGGTVAGTGLAAVGAGGTLALGPILLVIAAVAALVVLLAVLAGKSKDASKSVAGIGDSSKKALESVTNSTKSAQKSIQDMNKSVSESTSKANAVISQKRVYDGYTPGSTFSKNHTGSYKANVDRGGYDSYWDDEMMDYVEVDGVLVKNPGERYIFGSNGEGETRQMTEEELKKFNKQINGQLPAGYATGTRNVKQDGWYRVEEGNRKEMYFHKGDQIVNADDTQYQEKVSNNNSNNDEQISLLKELVSEFRGLKRAYEEIPYKIKVEGRVKGI